MTMNMQLWLSITSSLTLSLAFVGSLYLFVPQKIQKLPRDDSLHIWARIRVVIGYAITATIIVAAASSAAHHYSSSLTGVREGVLRSQSSFLEGFTASIQELVLPSQGLIAELQSALYGTVAIMVLFSGHFLAVYKLKAYDSLTQCDWYDIQELRADVIRDLFLGPVMEEWVFRYLMDHILRLGGMRMTWRVIVGPWLFSIGMGSVFGAHIHHYFRLRKTDQYALAKVALQCAYTGLFGIISWVLMNKTGCISANIAAHMCCNLVGLPKSPYTESGKLGKLFAFASSLLFPLINKESRGADHFLLVAYILGIGSFIAFLVFIAP